MSGNVWAKPPGPVPPDTTPPSWTKPGGSVAPEINPTSGTSAIALITGILLLASERFRSRQKKPNQ